MGGWGRRQPSLLSFWRGGFLEICSAWTQWRGAFWTRQLQYAATSLLSDRVLPPPALRNDAECLHGAARASVALIGVDVPSRLVQGYVYFWNVASERCVKKQRLREDGDRASQSIRSLSTVAGELLVSSPTRV